jgi:hypothetical protein
LLQSLLVDFEFPIKTIEEIKKQYEQHPNKNLKRIKMSFGVPITNNHTEVQMAGEKDKKISLVPEEYELMMERQRMGLSYFA